MRELIIATKNKGKAREFSHLLFPFNFQIKSLHDLDRDIQIQETGTSFEENAILKAEQTRDLLNSHVLSDDSGLLVDALDGAPGIYSARYAGEDASDEANNTKLLQALQAVPEAERTARFVAVIALALTSGEIITKEGVCEGRIAFEPSGQDGFGYDPFFIPKGYDQTMAELGAAEKNKISHRRQALDKLVNWLQANEDRL